MTVCSILVVDDDPAIRELIALALVDEGYAVVTAADGATALLLVERGRPSVVLLDLSMPTLDGRGFLRGLGVRGIILPVIIVSAERDARRTAAELGVAAVLSKPFDLDKMLATVDRVCHRQAA